MGAVSTTIRVNDQFSSAISRMNGALNRLNRSLDGTRAKLGTMNSAEIAEAQLDISRLSTELNKVNNAAQRASGGMGNFNNRLGKTSTMSGLVATKLRQLASAYLGIQGMGMMVKTSDDLTNIVSRLKLINDGQQTVADLQGMIYRAAERSRSSYLETARTVARVGMNAKNAFKNTQEMVAFAEILNKQFVLGGATLEEQRSAMIQLTQALGSGVLRGEELNSVFESAPNIVQSIADYMGVPIGSIRELAAEGVITADTIKNAMFASAESVNKKLEQMPKTWGQVWQDFKNKALIAFNPVYEKLRSFANSKIFESLANATLNIIYYLGKGINWAFDLVGKAIDFLKEKFFILQPIIMGLGTAFAILKGKMMLSAVWAGICAVAHGVLTGAKIVATFFTWAFTKATLAQAGAQWGLNAALYACPLTWVVLAIIAVIVAIYLCVAAINKFQGTSYSATGFIAGCFMWLWASIVNGLIHTYTFFCDALEWIANTAYEVAYWIYDGFFNCVEAIVNFFLEGFHKAKQGMVNFAVSVLECCVSMCEGIDSFVNALANGFIWAVNEALGAWNSLIDALPSSVTKFLGVGKATLLSKSETSVTAGIQSDLNGAIAKAKGELSDYTPYKIERSWDGSYEKYKVDRKWTDADLLDKSSYFDKGYKWGEGVAEKFNLSTLTDKLTSVPDEIAKNLGINNNASNTWADSVGKMGTKNPDGSVNSMSPSDLGVSGYDPDKKLRDKINKILGNTDEIADNTGSGREQELKYLLELGERRAINRFTTAEIHVSGTTFNNNVNKNMDLDGVKQQVERIFKDGYTKAAQGVYEPVEV